MDWCLNDPDSPVAYLAFDAGGDLEALSSSLKGKRVSFVTCAATPVTLPEELEIAVHPELEYVLYDVGERVICVAKDQLPGVLAECRAEHLIIREVKLSGQAEPVPGAVMADPTRILAYASGADLVGLPCRHPRSGRISAVVADERVALEPGTGLRLR